MSSDTLITGPQTGPILYENIQNNSPQIFSLLDNMSFAEYFAKFDEPTLQPPIRPSRLSKLSAITSNSHALVKDRYENIESGSSGIYEDCEFNYPFSPSPPAPEEVHYSVPKCTPTRFATEPLHPSSPVLETSSAPAPPKKSYVSNDRDTEEDFFHNPVIPPPKLIKPKLIPALPSSNSAPQFNVQSADTASDSDSVHANPHFNHCVSPSTDYETEEYNLFPVILRNPSGYRDTAQLSDTPQGGAEIISSINGITTIQINPVHHVIELPPKKIEEIRRRRAQFKKSSRLSQFMTSDFKLDPPIHGINMNRFGNVVRKKVGGWVKKIQDEVDHQGHSVQGGEKYHNSNTLSRVNNHLQNPHNNSPGSNSPQTPRPHGYNNSAANFSESSSLQSEFQSQDFLYDGILGQNEFEDLRKLVKQGGDFCKDLSAVLQERSELEAQYSKGLAKLSSKLLKASKEATGSVAHAWQAVAVHIDTQAELHRCWSSVLQDELAKPLKSSTETQSKIRKSVEGLVEKTTRNLAEWRTAESKAKRQCFSSSKEFEKLQDTLPNAEIKSRLLSVPPSDPIKMEAKKRKAEETVRRADIEYYTFCVRSERARLEWESSIRNGSTCLRTLEEEKLTLLKDLALKYFDSMNDIMPKLMRSTEVLEEPIKACNVEQDMQTIIVRRACSEQLLPDFYAEDTSNLMRKERRSEVLQKCLFLITQDLDRERKGAIGVEHLAKAIADSTKIDNTQNDVSDKLYYLKSMLLYLEAARIKLEVAIADIDGRPKPISSLTKYLRHQRDKQGLPQTILKVPSWARDECLTPSPSSESPPHWTDNKRNNNQVNIADHDTDFDEFSSEAGSSDNVYEEEKEDVPSIGKCRVLYDYDKNLFDELTIRAGDVIKIHDKQEDGWWLGELKGTIGIFPATYVEEVEESLGAEQSS